MTRIPRTLPVLLAAALLAAGARAGRPKGPEAPGREAIDRAIDRGAAWLEAAQKPDGSWKRDLGTTSLAALALFHSGAKPGERVLRKAVSALHLRLGRPDTYGASTAVMALATLDPVKYRASITRLVRLLERAQCRNGQWSYRLRAGGRAGDNSNTQFALLALWYARRAGVKVDRAVFARSLTFFERTQSEADGGWGYSEKERARSYGSMTATGLAVLVIAKGGARGLNLADPRVRRGMRLKRAAAWIADHFSVQRNPKANFKLGAGMRGTRKDVKDSFWKHYWLWSLERAATLAGRERFGKHDWYAEGARHLLETQRDDGSWVGSEAPHLATSFALLFLTRSTRRAVLTEKERRKPLTTPSPR